MRAVDVSDKVVYCREFYKKLTDEEWEEERKSVEMYRQKMPYATLEDRLYEEEELKGLFWLDVAKLRLTDMVIRKNSQTTIVGSGTSFTARAKQGPASFVKLLQPGVETELPEGLKVQSVYTAARNIGRKLRTARANGKVYIMLE